MRGLIKKLKYYFKHDTFLSVLISILITFSLVLISIAIDNPSSINNTANSIKDSSSSIASSITSRTLSLFGVDVDDIAIEPEPVLVAVVGDCEDEGNQANCNAMPGCSWTGGTTVQCSTFTWNNCPTSCVKTTPTPVSCSQFNGNETACIDTIGCSWEEECTTTTKQCSLLSVLNCNNYDGCWVQVNSTPAYCSCSAFNASQALCENNGCTWYNQQTTSQCKGTYQTTTCDDVCEGTYQSGGSCTGSYQTGGSCTGDPIQNSPEPSPNCTSFGFNCVSQSLCSAEGGTVKSGYACSSGKICCNLPTNPSPSSSSSGGSGGGGNTPPGVCEPECTSSSQCGAGRYCVYSSDGCTNYCDDKPQICNAGESRCIGNTLQKCSSDGTAYNTAQTCQSGTTCNSYLGICQQTISSGATICEPECTSSSQCEDDEYCSISSNGCSNYCVKQSCNPGTPPACKSYSPTSSYSLSCTSLGVEVALKCAYGCDDTKGTCFPPIQAQTITTTSITNCISDCRNEGNSPSECNAACIPAECEGIPIGSSCVVDNRGGTCELIPGNQKVCIPIPAETTNIRCNSTGAYIETKDDDNNWNPTEFCASYCSDASGFPTCIDLSNITYTPTFDPSDNLNLSQDPTVAAAFQAEYLNAINNCIASGKNQQECESIWAEPLQQATQTGDTCITYYTIQDPSRSIDDIKAQCDTEKANAILLLASTVGGVSLAAPLDQASIAAYSYATATLQTLPTWAQYSIGGGLLIADIVGNIAGSNACINDPTSELCAGFIAGWQLGFLNQLATDIDNLLPSQQQLLSLFDNLDDPYQTSLLYDTLYEYDGYEAYQWYVSNYGKPPTTINTGKNPTSLYGFQEDLVAAANGANIDLDLLITQLADAGIGVNAYNPSQMTYASQLLDQGYAPSQVVAMVDQATLNGTLPYGNPASCPLGFCPSKPETSGIWPFKKTTQQVFVLQPEYYPSNFSQPLMTTSEGQTQFLQKLGHEAGHAADDIYLGGLSAWGTEINQKQFNAIFYQNVDPELAKQYQIFVDQAIYNAQASGGNVYFNVNPSLGKWTSTITTPTISNATNFKELLSAIDNLPNGLTNSSGVHYTQSQLREQIQGYINGSISIDYITSAGGLYEKILELSR